VRPLLVASVLIAAAAVRAATQQRDVTPPALGTAQITGIVLTADKTPAPVRRAIVSLIGERADHPLAVTDDTGRFAFVNLPADRYSLSVAKSAFVPLVYGSKRPGGSGVPIVLADGQRIAVSLNLLRGSVITGTVRDERGRPLPGVTVTALRYAVSYQTGERTLQSVTVGSAGSVVAGFSPEAFPGTGATDDRGEYRIYGLAPGDYIIRAAARPPYSSIMAGTDVRRMTDADVQRAQRLLQGPGSVSGTDTAGARSDASRVDYVPIYHPGALDAADAATVTVGPAEERAGVDVLLRYVPTAAIVGVVTGPDGSPVPGAQIALMTNPRSSSGGVDRSARSNDDGEFVLPGIPPGRYEIQASTYPAGFFGTVEVSIDGRGVATSIVLAPGTTISGRIVFDGSSRAPAPNTLPLILRRQFFSTGSTSYQIEADGRFTYSRVAPGRYRLNINGRPPAGWILRSATVNGADASDVEFDVKPQANIENVVITLTDRPAELSGVLQHGDGSPAPDYVLVVFSADPAFRVPRTRRTQQVRPDINGRFIARDLPAGEYFISAVTDLENGQWNDPAFLAELAATSPIKISLAEGDKKIQNIRIGGR